MPATWASILCLQNGGGLQPLRPPVPGPRFSSLLPSLQGPRPSPSVQGISFVPAVALLCNNAVFMPKTTRSLCWEEAGRPAPRAPGSCRHPHSPCRGSHRGACVARALSVLCPLERQPLCRARRLVWHSESSDRAAEMTHELEKRAVASGRTLPQLEAPAPGQARGRTRPPRERGTLGWAPGRIGVMGVTGRKGTERGMSCEHREQTSPAGHLDRNGQPRVCPGRSARPLVAGWRGRVRESPQPLGGNRVLWQRGQWTGWLYQGPSVPQAPQPPQLPPSWPP